MKFNRDNTDQRDMILFGEHYNEKNYPGGIRRFKKMTYSDYLQLLNIDVIDPEDRQNAAPSVREIAEFLRTHPSFYAHGYAVSPERDDCRVSLEGVECEGLFTLNDVVDFFQVFTCPDEFTVTHELVWCWYD